MKYRIVKISSSSKIHLFRIDFKTWYFPKWYSSDLYFDSFEAAEEIIFKKLSEGQERIEVVKTYNLNLFSRFVQTK